MSEKRAFFIEIVSPTKSALVNIFEISSIYMPNTLCISITMLDHTLEFYYPDLESTKAEMKRIKDVLKQLG